ncbi:hypothetical protein LMG31886_18600 [Xanthomonas hydrangeae]|nr:hypothetical protein LMG31886_18600 [Xanthomonas hydrangeae]CAD7733200.1 hypothetical protein LMG31886_18600 [Xanthomonas hydrangeae]CAD7746482.1 hypothetical protein LMG31885_41630 [Xanthomonas hydrangeae]CAD7746484.1 hypothetical protein LMG31885_41630 [Xanthomonas hydrangeae]
MRCLNNAHRPSRLVLARPPSRDLTRHGCRVRAYTDVLAACPAMVGGQGPCNQAADQPLYTRCIQGVRSLQAKREFASQRRRDASNAWFKSSARRERKALTARGTRRESVMENPWRHPDAAKGPASGKGIAPGDSVVCCWSRRPSTTAGRGRLHRMLPALQQHFGQHRRIMVEVMTTRARNHLDTACA